MITRLEQRMILLKLNQKWIKMMIRFLYLKTNLKKVNAQLVLFIIHRKVIIQSKSIDIMILIDLYLHTHIHT